MKSQKGATPLEVFIGIFAMLAVSYCIYFFLNDAQDNASVANIRSILGNLRGTAVACLDSGRELSNGSKDTVGDAPVVGMPICESANATWPKLGGDWVYASSTISNISSNTFSYSVSSVSEKKTILCDEKTCTINQSN